MSHPCTPVRTVPSLAVLHIRFLRILPRIQLHGRIYFRHVRCRHKKEDAIQEMVALSWKWFLRLAQRGKDGTRFPSALATYAAKAVRCGRRLHRQENERDVLSPLTQQRRGFTLAKLPDHATLYSNPLDEALHDNTVSPVSDQVAFRLDFPAWLGSLGQRNRQVAEDLMMGERTLDVAHKYGLCAARVSQLRREFQQDWKRFCDDGEILSLLEV
jgi:hypothetical protein